MRIGPTKNRARTDLIPLADAAWRIAGAIVLDAFAFTLWSVGTRSPLALLRAIGASLSHPRALITGILSALIGLVFIAAAAILILPAMVDLEHDFIPVELGTLLCALALEQLIGHDVCSFIRRHVSAA